jgi:membrane fusion protein, multidrug efflux system
MPQARATTLMVTLAAALALGVAGCDGGPPADAAGAPGNTKAGPPGKGPGGMGFGGAGPVAVITQPVTPRSFVDRFTALGTARASESIEVTARSSSIVTRINFREGQWVRTGDVLVELDTRQERAAVTLAEAQLRQAESQYRRSDALRATKAVSEADLDQLEANLSVARAQVQGARARLDTLTVKAPFAGTVGLRKVSLGDLVGPDTRITTLDDTATIKLEFSVPEAFIANVKTGMAISAASSVYADQPFAGVVESIDSRVDPVTRSVVVARLPNNDAATSRRLKPGMFLTVVLENRRDNVIVVPEEALVPREGRQFVYLAVAGKATEREVTLGGRTPGLAEVRTGLEAGDQLITEGTQRLRDGVPIRGNGAS